MKRRRAWEPWLAVGAAASVFVLVLAWPALRPLRPLPAERPAGAPAAGLRGGVAAIAPWTAFWIDESNPFVPWEEREASSANPGRSRGWPPPRGPVDEPQPQPVPESLPRAAPGGGGAPRALGFQDPSLRDAAVLVLLAGEARARPMRPGETVGGWTFIGIEAGNVAEFRGADGRRFAAIIGAGR